MCELQHAMMTSKTKQATYVHHRKTPRDFAPNFDVVENVSKRSQQQQ